MKGGETPNGKKKLGVQRAEWWAESRYQMQFYIKS